ncbi:unnamed protein product [Didymodactylos carnosus]|uniref:U-box domain-containing protein n=1 Tax=Didymodactylos carnosus TaxID=1234261 RepID=A0A8S2F8I2_9BILA|nr:unnamed protein product [Didymodactylos carnosus]CAF4178868.1 unnamed protein product [Didymodactylos carnosus]
MPNPNITVSRLESLRIKIMAADGFTYEHEFIEKWLEENSRSPMTNEELQHKNLTPNKAIIHILNALKNQNYDVERKNALRIDRFCKRI